jgi:hypothetical protein
MVTHNEVCEDTADWKDLDSAVVIWWLWRIIKVLQLSAVKSNKCLINSITNATHDNINSKHDSSVLLLVNPFYS